MERDPVLTQLLNSSTAVAAKVQQLPQEFWYLIAPMHLSPRKSTPFLKYVMLRISYKTINDHELDPILVFLSVFYQYQQIIIKIYTLTVGKARSFSRK